MRRYRAPRPQQREIAPGCTWSSPRRRRSGSFATCSTASRASWWGTLVEGVYTVRLPVGASERERVEAIAARLRGEPRVRIVAVDPRRSP
jgi:hypothetical protein